MTSPNGDGSGRSMSGHGAFLEGVRLLDITGALAGPYCTTILGDLGAEVIKVEPVDGDAMRQRMVGSPRTPLPFDLVHRGKRSLAIDIKSAAGSEIVRELAKRVDVLVENFRVGAMARCGLSYDDLAESCPDLVYCSISGFGQNGPMRNAKGVDLIAQAYGGLMSVTGSSSRHLAKAGFPIADLGSGMWAAIGVLAALERVRRGFGGAYIDVSLADTIAGWSVWEIADYIGTAEVPQPLGTAHRLAAPYQAFTCQDGEMLVIAGTDRSWLPLCEVLSIDLRDDSRFDTEYQRYVHREELAVILQERFGSQPRDHWISGLRDAGVPCGPVNGIDQVVEDPQFAARKLFLRDPERFGQDLVVNTPLVSEGVPRARGAAPGIGADSTSLLGELGFDEDEIAELVKSGIVGVDTRWERRAS
ncbi:CaiB/BaiF CoA transferase family protein [Nocardia carnea]|uniref:CaiB/BaiF CoA transferase family protein n=1 Tax=Nocardia carnea TaxID=37328 RepID=UPI0024569AE0|nr:CaiB/BaiF CoA-transferase family protein [Nocardia carnea]